MADKKKKSVNYRIIAALVVVLLIAAGVTVLLVVLLSAPPSARDAYMAVSDVVESEKYEEFHNESVALRNKIIANDIDESVKIKFEIVEAANESFQIFITEFYMKNMIFANESEITKEVIETSKKLEESILNCNNYLSGIETLTPGYWTTVESNIFLKEYQKLLKAEKDLVLVLNKYYQEAVMMGQFVNEETKLFSKTVSEKFKALVDKTDGIEKESYEYAEVKGEAMALRTLILGGVS